MLSGRVVVIAGETAVLAPVCDAAADAGALVAFVSLSLTRPKTARMFFRASGADSDVWPRTAMHIEQQLGPVDGVVVDESAAAVVSAVFGPDLARRGHGGVVVTGHADPPSEVVSRLADTQRAAPA